MKYLDYLLSVKEKGTQGRLGIIFKTKNNFYLFDAGTNKVAIIDEPQGLEFLSMFFNDAITVEKFKSYVDAHATDNTIYSFPSLNLHQGRSINLLLMFSLFFRHSLSKSSCITFQFINKIKP